jgi:DNA-binding response OmpR family regulator
MRTARGGVMDRIVGLELGADDYLPKPFEPRELVARLQAVLRRGAGGEADESVRVGPLEIRWDSRTTRLDGRPLELTTAEFALLALLVKSRGRVLTRDRILEATRGLDWEAYYRSIDVSSPGCAEARRRRAIPSTLTARRRLSVHRGDNG